MPNVNSAHPGGAYVVGVVLTDQLAGALASGPPA